MAATTWSIVSQSLTCKLPFVAKRRRPLDQFTSLKRDGENAFDPVFQIVRFTDDDAVIPGLCLAKNAPAVADEPKPQTNGGGGRGVGDEIPFAAEFR